MTYALIDKGAVSRYPYVLRDLRAAHPQTSFPAEPTAELLAEYGMHPVAETAAPVPSAQQNLVEGTPTLVKGTWTQNWELTEASAEEIAARTQAAQEDAAGAEVRADSFVAAFLAMTPAQLGAYVDNNTATLVQTRALLKKMALMLLVVGRQGGLR